MFDPDFEYGVICGFQIAVLVFTQLFHYYFDKNTIRKYTACLSDNVLQFLIAMG